MRVRSTPIGSDPRPGKTTGTNATRHGYRNSRRPGAFEQGILLHNYKPHGPWACLKNCPWYPPALSNIGDQFLGLKFSQFSGQNEMGNTYDWLGGPNRFFWGSGHWWAWEGSFNLTQPMGILCLWNFWDLHIW